MFPKRVWWFTGLQLLGWSRDNGDCVMGLWPEINALLKHPSECCLKIKLHSNNSVQLNLMNFIYPLGTSYAVSIVYSFPQYTVLAVSVTEIQHSLLHCFNNRKWGNTSADFGVTWPTSGCLLLVPSKLTAHSKCAVTIHSKCWASWVCMVMYTAFAYFHSVNTLDTDYVLCSWDTAHHWCSSVADPVLWPLCGCG